MATPDHVKRKIDLMRGIMKNPKLAKTFKEAMSSPIGSTKREHVKSILSIMKKVKGINDGQGGPLDSMFSNSSMMNNPNDPNSMPSSSLTSSFSPDYSNMMIFPATPSFRSFTSSPVTKNLTSANTSFNSSTPPVLPGGSLFNNQSSSGSSNIYSGLSSILNSLPKSNILSGFTLPTFGATEPSGLDMNGTPIMTKVPISSSAPVTPPVTSPAITTPTVATTPATSTTPPVTTSTTPVTSPSITPKTTTPPVPLSPADQIKADAAKAVKSQTGPGLFAMNEADAKFGGSLDEYINKLDAKLKTDFNITPLEEQLTSLKAEKGNLVPTLTQYVQGRDQYMGTIDKLISDQQARLTTTNMNDPLEATNYNNYLSYLYTLKGRQGQREDNFLNSAIADYNADVQKVSDQYTNVYKNYTDALTRGATIAQTEYTTLYNTMSDLYNNLDQAPTKALNLAILNQTYLQNKATLAANALAQGNATNPKILSDASTLIKMITDSNATGEYQGDLDITKLPGGSLAGLFAINSYAGSDPAAAAYAVNSTMAKSLQNTPDIAEAMKFQKLIKDLSTTAGGGDQLAAMLTPSLTKNAFPIISTYVTSNLGNIKNAAKDLVQGSGWINKSKPGLQDKVGWENKYKGSVDPEILNNLYDYVSLNITPGSDYEKNPSSFINAFFAGTPSQVATSLMTTW